MRYTTIFFDLDGTLYSDQTGLWEAIKARMSSYMADRLGLPWESIPELRSHFYRTYGTTLRGLQIHYQVDPDDYLAYVHDLQLENYLEKTPELRKMLESLPQVCWIFTNADVEHARRVLKILDVLDCFEGIIDVHAIEFACKPEPVAYQRALTLAGEPDPQRCLILDDSVENLLAARELGFTTVLVGWDGVHPQTNSYRIPNILALRESLPELWEDGDGSR